MTQTHEPTPAADSRKISLSERMAQAELENRIASKKLDKIRKRERDEMLLALAEADEASWFCNLPEAMANFKFWARQAWTLQDAVALSFSRDPRIVNTRSMSPITSISKLARQFMDRYAFVRYAFDRSELFNPNAPIIFISWARGVGIEMPTDLVAEVERAPENAARRLVMPEEFDRLEAENVRLKDEVRRTNARVAELEIKLAAEEMSENSRSGEKRVWQAVLVSGCRYDPANPIPTSKIAAKIRRNAESVLTTRIADVKTIERYIEPLIRELDDASKITT